MGLIAKKKISTNAFCVLTTTKYGMKEIKKKTPRKLSSSLNQKRKSKKSIVNFERCVLLYTSRPTKKSLFFLTKIKSTILHFFSKQKQFSKINFIIPLFRKIKIRTKIFATVR